ncbi:hypothetical protein COLO4_37077 [Corchorus olitorius]|uniref:Uncharacterized protein n=1 Tax=Corchorus olitorius TaxID=93759 RepID=A0A1R3G3F9_9ROSI|nr:hypothetical protein COLO4_37077 [Corchorus olitorius]
MNLEAEDSYLVPSVGEGDGGGSPRGAWFDAGDEWIRR